MIKAVIFDKDGVISDSVPFMFKVFSSLLGKYQIKCELNTLYDKLFQNMMSGYDVYPELHNHITYKEYRAGLREIYNDLFDKEFKLIPGAKDTISQLSKRYTLALASSNHQHTIDKEFTKFDLKRYFKSIVTGDDIHVDKPDPGAYLLTLKNLNLKPDECIVVEDTTVGLKAANAAGMKCIILLHDYAKDYDYSMAFATITSLAELESTINKI